MSAPLFSLRPAYDDWYEFLDLNNWEAEDFANAIKKVCDQAYRWSIPMGVCVRDTRTRIFIELNRDVPPLDVVNFYRRARRDLTTEKCAHFGLITREGRRERQEHQSGGFRDE